MQEVRELRDTLGDAWTGTGVRGVPAMGARVVAVDGDAAYSRPGPRVAEGIAQFAHLLHPLEVDAPQLPSRQLIPV